MECSTLFCRIFAAFVILSLLTFVVEPLFVGDFFEIFDSVIFELLFWLSHYFSYLDKIFITNFYSRYGVLFSHLNCCLTYFLLAMLIFILSPESLFLFAILVSVLSLESHFLFLILISVLFLESLFSRRIALFGLG